MLGLGVAFVNDDGEDLIYRQARMIAAERNTSISALVKEYLVSLGAEGSQVERLKRQERALRERITSFRASDKLSRDELRLSKAD